MLKATTRILQFQYKLSRKQAVRFHKEYGSDFETVEEIKEKAGKIKTKHLEEQQKQSQAWKKRR